jgi:DNA-binding beta-propeller fold protein YncE
MKPSFARKIAPLALAAVLSGASADGQVFTHTEARHTHSIGLTPDGTRLLALHSDDARLSVFDPSGATPVLVAEIPVGLEPVALRARTNDEVWVVSELGDSVAIVSLSRSALVATLRAPDEPSDVVFAQGKAFVSCARNRLVRVFDSATREEVATIPLGGLEPRALATDAAGTRVFAAFLHSGNGTTLLPPNLSPAPPPPTNPSLPAAPKTGLIVPVSDSRIRYTVLDRDVAEIDAATLSITRYLPGAGTHLFDLALQPGTGDVWVANTDARNLIRFEPNLRGHFVDHRITRLSASTGAPTVFDLNPGIDYATLPNPSAQATALAQPTALSFSASGTDLWIAAFGSDRIARVDPGNGAVLEITDLRPPGDDTRRMRGPRALALDEARGRLYVLNKISASLSAIDTGSGEVLAEVALGSRDPMPAALRAGRGFLFDARLSGNGTASCASCHLDADRDGLAWDLGDPGGEMTTVTGANLSAHDTTPRQRNMHPMKGPMTTQTLRGLSGGAPFHWRGDRPTLQSFNGTFHSLLGGAELPPADIDMLANYLFSLRHHPNPNRQLDGSLPLEVNGGNPTRGQNLFAQHLNHCAVCHTLPRGTDNNIDLHAEVGASQPVKNPPLATVYQRFGFNPQAGQTSLTGFGLLHDGSGSILPTVHPYVLDVLGGSDFADVAAFILCFDTGTAPSVGDSITISGTHAASALADIGRLEARAVSGALDLVARGRVGGEERGYFYSRTLQLYVPDVFGGTPLSRSELIAALGAEDALTFLGVPPGEGARFAGDLDRNATPLPDSYFTRSKTKPLEIPATIGVLANDARVAPPADLASISTLPANGSALLASDGALRYTPGTAFAESGFDRLSYRVHIGGDPGNASAETSATISTFSSASGKYFGLLRKDGGPEINGFVKVQVTSIGTWTGTARIDSAVQTLKGTIAADGELRPHRDPKLNVTLRLWVDDEGRRRISANARQEARLFVATMQRSPYAKGVPAPGAGRHSLTLTVSSASENAPLDPGKAKATIGKQGAAKLKGRLGDRTPFSMSVPLAEGNDGGWLLPVYTPVFRSPPGSVSGELEFAPAGQIVSGVLTAIRPPQTRPANAAAPYTIRYDANETPTP